MPPRPPLEVMLSSVAACSCRPALASTSAPPRQRTLATVSLSSIPEPTLDFLYPSFGFFSRSLPKSPPAAPPPLKSRWSRQSYVAKVGTVEPGRSWSTVGVRKCPCGRPSQSCSRCRRASTSARVAPAPPPSPTPFDPPYSFSDGQAFEDTTPPRPPRPPRPKKSERLSSAHDPRPLLSRLDRALPDIRSATGSHPNQGPSEWTVLKAKSTLASLLQIADPARSKTYQMNPTERLDLIRLISRVARAPPFPYQELPYPNAVLSSSEAAQKELYSLRHRAGQEISRLLTLLFSPQDAICHQRSKALLRLDAMDLTSTLPHSLSPTPFDDVEDAFAADLRVIFAAPESTADPNLARSCVLTQRTALCILFQTWRGHSYGGINALHLVHGANLEAVFLAANPTERDPFGDVLRRMYGGLLARIRPSPAEWFEQQTKSKDPVGQGAHLVNHLALSGSPLQALAVWDVLMAREHPIAASVDLQVSSKLLDGLSRQKFHTEAGRVARHVERITRSESLISDPQRQAALATAYHALARNSATDGNARQVEKYVKRLEQFEGKSGLEVVAMRIRAAAKNGSAWSVRQIFDGARGVPASDADRARLWGILIGAYVKVNDVESAVAAVDQLVTEGLRPTVATLNRLISAYATRAAEEPAYAMFHRISYFKLAPDVVSYNALAALHANLKDPDSAERVIEKMVAKGLRPDRFTWTSLMEAHLAVGQWRQTLEIFSYLQAQDDPTLRPDVAVTNLVLKASVVAGTPAVTTLRIFRLALDRGFRPSPRTYAHVMHALCTAGLMDLAEELFAIMDEQRAGPLSLPGSLPDVHIFSMLMYGYLQRNEPLKARGCLREMQARNIRPTSVTYAIVVASFLRMNSPDGLKMALGLAKNFLENSPLGEVRGREDAKRDLLLVRGEELLALFVPIVNAFAKNADARLALEYFRQVLHQNVKPSIPLYTALMDAYRRVGDVASVEQVWKHLHDKVVSSFGIDHNDLSRDADPHVEPTHANALCRGFTVFIDALTTAGQYDVIFARWKRHAAEGFLFDTSNWNALGVAACAAGNVELAFWIAECVLGPGRQEFVNPAVVSLEFGPPTVVDPSMETRLRLYQGREWERERHTRFPATLTGILASTPDPIDLSLTFEAATGARRGTTWFPHTAFLQALEEALHSVSLLPEHRALLERDHPETMTALKRMHARDRQPRLWQASLRAN